MHRIKRHPLETGVVAYRSHGDFWGFMSVVCLKSPRPDEAGACTHWRISGADSIARPQLVERPSRATTIGQFLAVEGVAPYEWLSRRSDCEFQNREHSVLDRAKYFTGSPGAKLEIEAFCVSI